MTYEMRNWFYEAMKNGLSVDDAFDVVEKTCEMDGAFEQRLRFNALIESKKCAR